MLYQTRDHSPSAINHVEHDLPILKYVIYRKRCAFDSAHTYTLKTGKVVIPMVNVRILNQ